MVNQTDSFQSISVEKLKEDISIDPILNEDILNFNKPLLKIDLPKIGNSKFAKTDLATVNDIYLNKKNELIYNLKDFPNVDSFTLSLKLRYPIKISTQKLLPGNSRLPEGHSFKIKENIIEYTPRMGSRVPLNKESINETIKVFDENENHLSIETFGNDEENSFIFSYKETIGRVEFFLCTEMATIQEEFVVKADFQSVNPNSLSYQAKTLFYEQKYQEALNLFLENVENHEDLEEHNKNVGLTYFYLQDYSNAADYLEDHLTECSEDYQILRFLATTYTHLQKFDEAKSFYTKALTLTPESESAELFGDVGIFYSQLNPKLSQAYLEKAVTINPDLPNNSWFFLASLYEKQKENLKALNAYKNIYRIFPDYRGASYALYILNLKEKNYDEAEKSIYHDIETGNGDKALNYFKIAIINYIRWYKNEAAEAFKRVSEIL